MSKRLDFLRSAYEATKSAESAVNEATGDIPPVGLYFGYIERVQMGLADASAYLLRLIDDAEAWGA